MTYTCKLCYREFQEKEMQNNIMGQASDYCIYCHRLLGKGPGYDDADTLQESEKWLEGSKDRKEEFRRKMGL